MTKKARIKWRNICAPLSRVIPWEHNPKHISKDRAERLLKLWDDLGQFQTIAVGPDFELYDGHQRYNVLRAAGRLELEVDMRQSSRPLTKRERERLIVESHATATGFFDWDMLANEFDPKDLEAYGLTKKISSEWKSDLANLQALIKSSRSLLENTSDDEDLVKRAEALLKRWKVKRGDLWELGDHALLCGDSTLEEDVARLFPTRIADLTATDPPYNVGIQYENEKSDHVSREEFDRFSVAWYTLARKYSSAQIVTPGAVNLQAWLRLFVDQDVSPWIKSNSMSRGYIARFMCWEPIVFSGVSRSKSRMSDVFDYPVSDQRMTDGETLTGLHPCPKPLELWRDLIESFTEKSALVFDPFGGSGTALVACEITGRFARAIEISPKYAAVILERYQRLTGKTPKRVS